MPVFACRLANGDVSFVGAENGEAAIEQLNPKWRGGIVVEVPDFHIRLKLTSVGEFDLRELGENTEAFVVNAMYPRLLEARRGNEPMDVRFAVKEERDPEGKSDRNS